MGNACCNYKDKDGNALNFLNNNEKPVKINASLKAAEDVGRENLDKVVKIQSAVRAQQARKEYEKEVGDHSSRSKKSSIKNPSKSGDNCIRHG